LFISVQAQNYSTSFKIIDYSTLAATPEGIGVHSNCRYCFWYIWCTSIKIKKLQPCNQLLVCYHYLQWVCISYTWPVVTCTIY